MKLRMKGAIINCHCGSNEFEKLDKKIGNAGLFRCEGCKDSFFVVARDIFEALEILSIMKVGEKE